MHQVIFITDGDLATKKVLEYVAIELNCRVISASYGNPTSIDNEELVACVLRAPEVPILIMFDDCGIREKGPGEKAMTYLAKHEEIEVIGAVAVASVTHAREWTHVDVCIDRFGERTAHGVDKEGLQELEIGRINGDTVSILDELEIPYVVGIGDIGKMARFDDVKRGAPITKKAIASILERSGYLETTYETDDI